MLARLARSAMGPALGPACLPRAPLGARTSAELADFYERETPIVCVSSDTVFSVLKYSYIIVAC